MNFSCLSYSESGDKILFFLKEAGKIEIDFQIWDPDSIIMEEVHQKLDRVGLLSLCDMYSTFLSPMLALPCFRF